MRTLHVVNPAVDLAVVSPDELLELSNGCQDYNSFHYPTPTPYLLIKRTDTVQEKWYRYNVTLTGGGVGQHRAGINALID